MQHIPREVAHVVAVVHVYALDDTASFCSVNSQPLRGSDVDARPSDMVDVVRVSCSIPVDVREASDPLPPLLSSVHAGLQWCKFEEMEVCWRREGGHNVCVLVIFVDRIVGQGAIDRYVLGSHISSYLALPG